MKRAIISIVICIIVSGCGQPKTDSNNIATAGKDIKALLRESIPPITDSTKIRWFIMVIAPRAFRDEEFKIPYEFLTKIGHKVKVASRDTVFATGVMGMVVKPQLTIKDIDTLKYDGIILVGGTGAAIYWDDLTIRRLVQYFERTPGKIVSAICLAPVTLARAGVLQDKKATVYKDRETIAELKKAGAIYQKENVVISGNVITAAGPTDALNFAKAIALSVK